MITKSRKKFSAILVRKFFSRDHLIGRGVYGGRGKLAFDRDILERVKGICFSYYPTEEKSLAWKECVNKINSYLL